MTTNLPRVYANTQHSRVLPEPVVALAPFLPWLETALGLLLLLGFGSRACLLGAAGLLILFAGGMAANLARGRQIDCGCRAANRPISWRLVVENTALAVGAVVASTGNPMGPLRALIQASPSATRSEALIMALLLGQGVVLYSIITTVPSVLRGSRWLLRYQESS